MIETCICPEAVVAQSWRQWETEHSTSDTGSLGASAARWDSQYIKSRWDYLGFLAILDIQANSVRYGKLTLSLLD